VDSSADRSDHGRQTQLGCCARGIPEVIPVTLDDSQPGVTQSGYTGSHTVLLRYLCPLVARRSQFSTVSEDLRTLFISILSSNFPFLGQYTPKKPGMWPKISFLRLNNNEEILSGEG
jgi:hypothetical protein